MRRIIVLSVLLAVAAAGGWYYYAGDTRPVTFRTAKVDRGDLLATVSASGTIEPEEVVDVGSQVAGLILSFGKDPRGSDRVVNFGSPVEKGTVLAQIDSKLYQTLVDRAEAMVAQGNALVVQADAGVSQAKANVRRAEADLGQMQAKLYQSDRDLVRARRLKTTSAIAELDFDVSEATARTNKAALAVGEATIAQTKAALEDAVANVAKAQATLADSKAALVNAQVNLGYCTIQSPVKGVIVDRRVNIGQTIVSNFSASSLFLIAKDLKRLQVWASVNEADIGNIFSGQKVSFTVDAYPGRVFSGVVVPDQPRLNASMTQNVVTYTVVVTTDNLDGKLLPYLTANMQFEVSKRSQVLMVPNSALRWKPNPKLVVEDERAAYVSAQRKKQVVPGQAPAPVADREQPDKGMLWVEDGVGLVRPVKVTTGSTDGQNTEIVAGDIHEGDAVVLGESRGGPATAAGGNPFAPKMFGGGKKQ